MRFVTRFERLNTNFTNVERTSETFTRLRRLDEDGEVYRGRVRNFVRRYEIAFSYFLNS